MEKPKKPIENAAVKRWLLANPVPRESTQITLLGDDLYSRQPICELAIQQGYNFIFVAKSSSHKSLDEWIGFLEKNREVITGEIKKYEKGKRRIYRLGWFFLLVFSNLCVIQKPNSLNKKFKSKSRISSLCI